MRRARSFVSNFKAFINRGNVAVRAVAVVIQASPRKGLLTAAAALVPVAASAALAQQPVRPLPKVGGCPVGYYSSGSYCVPSNGGNTRGAIERSGNSCPLGFYSSGSYCVSSPSSNREAIQKTGKSCPSGWFSSGSYCVKSR